jgi:transketolase
MPCESLFASQEKSYKNKVLLKNPILRIAIEASNDNVWYKYIGENGLLINVTEYQYSGPGSEVYQKAGFNKESIISKINKALKALE